jgi:hypothetical protein
MLAKTLLFCVAFMAQQPHTPDLDAQRAAMKKLEFLVGKWTGEARMLRAQGESLVMTQTEEAQYKLDGLILTIEGVGRDKADSKLALQAFGIVSFDDETGTYRMRAFNDGRFLETEVKLIDKGITWGFALGPYRTSSVMRIDENGNWTEQHQIAIGEQAPKKYMELSVSRK